MRSRVHPKYKTKYRVSNWAEYDRALVQRGDITLWISEDAIVSWKPAPTVQRGAQRKFSALAIETAPAFTLRVYAHALREEETDISFLGFGGSKRHPRGTERRVAAQGRKAIRVTPRRSKGAMARREGFDGQAALADVESANAELGMARREGFASSLRLRWLHNAKRCSQPPTLRFEELKKSKK